MFPRMTSEPPRRTVTASSRALHIRDGQPSDASAVEAVHYASREAAYRDRVAAWPPPGPDRAGRVERWEGWLSNPEISCLVGELDGEIVGFCTVRRSRDEGASPDRAEMPTLYVRPDFWNRGIGQALCHAGLGRAVERGFRTLTLWVLVLNERAIRFYEAFGFVADGSTKRERATPERLEARRYVIAVPEIDGE